MRPMRPNPIRPIRTRSFAPVTWEYDLADIASALPATAADRTNSRRVNDDCEFMESDVITLNSLRRPSAVHQERGARHITRGRRGQEDHGALDLVKFAPAAH